MFFSNFRHTIPTTICRNSLRTLQSNFSTSSTLWLRTSFFLIQVILTKIQILASNVSASLNGKGGLKIMVYDHLKIHENDIELAFFCFSMTWSWRISHFFLKLVFFLFFIYCHLCTIFQEYRCSPFPSTTSTRHTQQEHLWPFLWEGSSTCTQCVDC